MSTARTIKRYANRKLYDTRDSRYVTLDHIAAMVRAGDDVRVVENTTRADLTTATLAQIIFEEEKKAPRLSVAGLRKIIQGGMPAAAPSSAAPAAGTPVPPAAGTAGSGGGVDDAAAGADEQHAPTDHRFDARGAADVERFRREDVDAVDGQIDLGCAEQLRRPAPHRERRQPPAVEALLQRQLRVTLQHVHVRSDDVERARPELERGQRQP